jgi:competence protein ComEC
MMGVNLQGCTLSNQVSTPVFTFPGFVLGPGATVTVHSFSGANTGTDLYWGLGSGAWNDYSDTATLRQPDGTIISSMARWSWA